MSSKIGFLIISFILFTQLSVVNAKGDEHLKYEDIYEKIGYKSVQDELENSRNII